jgi:high-affinity Fe2+/Pb2+ permease
MPDSQEIPQITNELVDMSREYLRQEVVEPSKQLGKQAGLGIGGAIIVAIGAILAAWGVYYGLVMWLPEGDWWVVLARFITALVAAGVAGLVVWRMQSGNN